MMFAAIVLLTSLCVFGYSRVVSGFTLLTFDVDGTLVSSSGWAESAHGRAYPHAVSTIFGNTSVPPVPEALKREEFHGSTDGLILLRLARAALNIPPSESASKLDDLMGCMYDYISELSDEEVAEGLAVLPGVLSNLDNLSKMQEEVMCGLVTGNVEGIARRKMNSVGIYQTGALSSPSQSQASSNIWPGTADIAFLGGFGSDYCSGDVDDPARNYLDRGKQIGIAVARCREKLDLDEDGAHRILKRVVHIGDAPADVLAAKAFSEQYQRNGENLCVGLVAVATGSYSTKELQQLAGEEIPGKWEPSILEKGMNDPKFLQACGLS